MNKEIIVIEKITCDRCGSDYRVTPIEGEEGEKTYYICATCKSFLSLMILLEI